MKKNLLKSSLLISLLLTGCRVGPEYHPPTPQAPAEWKNKTPEETQEVVTPNVCHWWEIFGDPVLNQLERQAVENNPNLEVALARIEEAYAIAGVNSAALWPQVNLQPYYSDSGQLFKIYLPQGIPTTGPLAPLATALSTPFRAHIQQYTFPFNLSYELDLWGKYRSHYESAVATAQSEVEAYHAALLSLTSDVANSYFQLKTLEALVQVLEQTLQIRQQAYDISQNRFKYGIATKSEVASSSVELSNVESDYNDTLRQYGLQENILALLLGKPASEFEIAVEPLRNEPPQVPAGLPIATLRRRPDIAEAERAMASKHSELRATYADLYPSLTLTGSLGSLSPTFEDFFTFLSRYWAIGANINQTVFDAGRKGYNINAAWARFAEETGNYRQQVLTAFKEVEDSLNNLEYQKKQTDALQQSVADASQLTTYSQSRYSKGTRDYIEVITNQRTQLDAQRNYLIILGARYTSTIQLIKALGGGWDVPSNCD